MTENEQRQKERRKTVILIICAALVALCLVGLLVWQGLKAPELSKTQESSVLTQVIGFFKKGKDLFLRSERGDISVSIPACAIDQEGKIILTPLGPYFGTLGSTGSNWTRLRIVDISFVNKDNQLIERMEVPCPIRVCFTLTSNEWKHYVAVPSDFEVQYLDFDQTPADWIALPVIENSKTQELCGEHNRLGIFALAVLNIPSGEPGGPQQPIEIPTLPGVYDPLNQK